MIFSFRVPLVSPTINLAYKGMQKRSLSGKASKFKRQLTRAIASDAESFRAFVKLKDKKICLHVRVYIPRWLNKDGSVKKNDISNRIKLTEDALLEAIGIDDSQVWHLSIEKVQADFELTEFFLSEFLGHQNMPSYPDLQTQGQE